MQIDDMKETRQLLDDINNLFSNLEDVKRKLENQINTKEDETIDYLHELELGIGNPLEDEEGKFKILANTISCEQYIIAKYKTEERAKEILQEIINTYKFNRNSCQYNINIYYI